MTARAGEIELPTALVEIGLALLIGVERARVVGDLDVERLAARGKGHVGGQRRHLVLDIGVGFFAVGLAAPIERELQRDDLSSLLVEIGIVLANADAAVREAIGIGLAVLERRREHLLALLERELVGRKLLLRHPLLAQVRIHRIGAVGEVVQLYIREPAGEEVAERLELGFRIDGVGGRRTLHGGDAQQRRRERNPAQRPLPFVASARPHHPIFATNESEAPLLSIQLTFRSSPLLAPLKLNLR